MYQEANQRVQQLEQELEDREASAGDFEKLAERRKRQIDQLTAERDQAKSDYDGLTTQLRTKALAEKVAEASGLNCVPRIRGLIALAAENTDLDPAPEKATDRDVKDWIKALQEMDPSTFEAPRKRGRQSPAPGRPRFAPGEERTDSKSWHRIVENAPQHGGNRRW